MSKFVPALENSVAFTVYVTEPLVVLRMTPMYQSPGVSGGVELLKTVINSSLRAPLLLRYGELATVGSGKPLCTTKFTSSLGDNASNCARTALLETLYRK